MSREWKVRRWFGMDPLSVLPSCPTRVGMGRLCGGCVQTFEANGLNGLLATLLATALNWVLYGWTDWPWDD